MSTQTRADKYTLDRIERDLKEGTLKCPKAALENLAMVLSSLSLKNKKAAMRIGLELTDNSELFLFFVKCVSESRGWGRLVKAGFKSWYLDRPMEFVLFQTKTVPESSGWSHKQVLRKIRIAPKDGREEAVLGYILDTPCDLSQLPLLYRNLWLLDSAPEKSEAMSLLIKDLIISCDLPKEFIPVSESSEPYIWEAYLNTGISIRKLTEYLPYMTAALIWTEDENLEKLESILNNTSNMVAKNLKYYIAMSDQSDWALESPAENLIEDALIALMLSDS